MQRVEPDTGRGQAMKVLITGGTGFIGSKILKPVQGTRR